MYLNIRAGGLEKGDVSVSNLTRGREADLLLRSVDHDNIINGGEMLADALESVGGGVDGDLVLGVGDTQSLNINVHQLQLELRDLVVL